MKHVNLDPADLCPTGVRPMRAGDAFQSGASTRGRKTGPQQPCVYFLEAKGVPLVKIGTIIRAETIQQRIEMLQTGCPYELRLAFLVDGGGRREEYLYHRALDHLRFRGEWFRREGALADLLDAAKADEKTAHQMAERLIRP